MKGTTFALGFTQEGVPSKFMPSCYLRGVMFDDKQRPFVQIRNFDASDQSNSTIHLLPPVYLSPVNLKVSTYNAKIYDLSFAVNVFACPLGSMVFHAHLRQPTSMGNGRYPRYFPCVTRVVQSGVLV